LEFEVVVDRPAALLGIPQPCRYEAFGQLAWGAAVAETCEHAEGDEAVGRVAIAVGESAHVKPCGIAAGLLHLGVLGKSVVEFDPRHQHASAL